MSREGSIAGTLLFMLFGPLVWALYFLVVYGGHASFCAAGDRLPGMPAEVLPILLAAATAAAMALIAGALLWPSAPRRLLRAVPAGNPEAGFVTRVMRLLALLSLFGVGFAGIAMLIVPLCQQLR